MLKEKTIQNKEQVKVLLMNLDIINLHVNTNKYKSHNLEVGTLLQIFTDQKSVSD